MTSKCEYASAHHSLDLTEVWHGLDRPAIICGFHAQPAWLEDSLKHINDKRKAEQKEATMEQTIPTHAVGQLERLQSTIKGLYADLATARLAHQTDIEKIGQALITAADENDFCSEYDRVITGINTALNIPLQTREREFTVTVTGTVTFSRDVTVTAIDEQQASDLAAEDFDQSSIEWLDVRGGDVELTDSNLFDVGEN